MTKLKAKTNSTGPIIKRQFKDELNYKYIEPVKDFTKYNKTKIKICQDVNAHDSYKTHPLNIFFN